MIAEFPPMTNHDYIIQELLDTETLLPYYKILKRYVNGEYIAVNSKRYMWLSDAEKDVRVLRKYKKPIYHYVENQE